jgi:hypothetical protein
MPIVLWSLSNSPHRVENPVFLGGKQAMGMRAKLRHVSDTDLRSAKKAPEKFYRDLYGLKGKPADKNVLTQSLGNQLGHALKESPLGKEFLELPEVRRVVEATLQSRVPDPADQQVVTEKMLELLPKINFQPDFSAFTQSQHKATKTPKGLNLEKSWHCLQFMLSGKGQERDKDPIEKAILGGTEIADTEGVMDYGPVRYLEPAEVTKTTIALESYPIEQKAREFNPAAAEEAKIYCPDHTPEELIDYFNLLKNYYREAVSKEHAMLSWIE